jgi:hypothetical protein
MRVPWYSGCIRLSGRVFLLASERNRPLYMVLQWCYSSVTVVLQWCYSGVTVVLQWCYSGVTVVLQWCYSGVTVVLQFCHSRVMAVFQGCCSVVTYGTSSACTRGHKASVQFLCGDIPIPCVCVGVCVRVCV